MKNLTFKDFKIPASVYRLQLSADFSLKKARNVLPYLKNFGVEAVYFSPYFKAFTPHGYDITDPNAFNPLLGSLEEYEEFCKDMENLKLMHIADIVPNHMGIKGGQNVWWQDVLENGPYSEYASFFDINWSPEKKELQDKVLLPILSTFYGKVLENQEIKLNFEDGTFQILYTDFVLPLRPSSYAMILENEFKTMRAKNSQEEDDLVAYHSLIEHYQNFPVATQERLLAKREGKERLVALCKRSPLIRRHISRQVDLINGKKNRTASFDLFDRLLEMQFYRLSFWRVATHEINYRRFFNINELVSIRIEEEKVLESHHRWVFELIKEKKIHGIRIDHPDGLYDPIQYFKQLRQRVHTYTIIEKILEWKEKLPDEWDVEGTVGYDYLNILNGIFINQDNEKLFTEIYENFVEEKMDFDEILYQCKKIFTDFEMVSDVEALGLKIDSLSENNREYRDFTRHELTMALAEVIACFPVYRSYIAPEGAVSKRDRHNIKVAIDKAKNRARDLDPSIFDFLEKVLLVEVKVRSDEAILYREFVLRFQQLTAPMMAKGLEDTSFYRYNRLISLNEVGGSPPHFGHSVGEFHAHNAEKLEKWPFNFLATSSHDTKRSEDIRMRLNVLSEMPECWGKKVEKWNIINSKYNKGHVSPNIEYCIYQTLLGVWPSTSFKKGEYTLFCERVWQAVLKALREAKQETRWSLPNPLVEEEVHSFLFSILDRKRNNLFLADFLELHKIIDRYGAWNSISQVAIKIASPGVVDIFQGNEILTYRLVDPDNRAQIDFEARKKMLSHMKKKSVEESFANHDMSFVKFCIQNKGLHFRNSHKALFLEGKYLPLKAKGVKENHVIGFLREKGKEKLIILAGRFFAKLADAQWDLPLGKHTWGNTEMILPENLKKMYLIDLFTGRQINIKRKGGVNSLSLAEVFERLPVSYLYAS